MASFTRESLELLRNRIDLFEVISSYVQCTRSGSTYKALCPFHEEKTPSFIIKKGDSHYHCFGCGAHGDAIQFLMSHQSMSFQEAVELLAEKFQVSLEKTKEKEKQGLSKNILKDALEKAMQFYHFFLLHTEEGHEALSYLYKRGIDLAFIKMFQLGLSSKSAKFFQKYMLEKNCKKQVLQEIGLIKSSGYDFFSDRIMVPIRDAIGKIIGFSARKYKEETFGPKYVNTPDTILFKKSHILFGLNYCRKRIAKERRAIVVEGQFDALRLIYMGFTLSVAGQGTAFGEEHVKELKNLGVNQVYLALDPDAAGQEAAEKIGHLFQKEAIEVFIISLPQNSDPDSFLQEKGPEEWTKLLKNSSDYLTYLVKRMSQRLDIKSPAGKNEIIQTIAKKIRLWEHPLMVHESLRKLAKLTKTPESVIGVDSTITPNILIKKSANLSFTGVDPDRVMEADLLRWLFVSEGEEKLVQMAIKNLSQKHFKTDVCRRLFEKYLQAYQENKHQELLSFAIDLEDAEERLFLSEMLQKKVNKEKAYTSFADSMQKLLDRCWMDKREKIKMKIQNISATEEEILSLAKEFDQIKNNRPQVILPEENLKET